MLELAFWGSVAFVLYAYAGYPMALKGLATFRRRPVHAGDATPRVSVIIAAYTEERRIEKKLRNTLALTYPRERFEIIVASDCSSDRTDAIVRSFSDRGVTLVRAPERRGKEHAQRLAMEQASGEILVFSDVATVLEPSGVTQIVRSFSDPTVGCVSSVDRFVDADGRLSGEGAYVRYEMWLRDLETAVNSVVGLSGSFFAARRDLCRPWPDHLPSDFNVLLNTIKSGRRGVADRASVGYYPNIADEHKEFDRKVRTVLRGLSVLMHNRSLLNPIRYGLFSWQLASHKLCRWLAPFALVVALITNGLLLGEGAVYRAAFLGQVAWYAIAALGIASPRGMRHRLLKIPMYFVTVNASIVVAWGRYLIGQRATTWEPSQREAMVVE